MYRQKKVNQRNDDIFFANTNENTFECVNNNIPSQSQHHQQQVDIKMTLNFVIKFIITKNVLYLCI